MQVFSGDGYVYIIFFCHLQTLWQKIPSITVIIWTRQKHINESNFLTIFGKILQDLYFQLIIVRHTAQLSCDLYGQYKK